MPLQPGTHCANCMRIVILSATKDLRGKISNHVCENREELILAKTAALNYARADSSCSKA
jgi:hypothetical protein